jgi:hypothetical protein
MNNIFAITTFTKLENDETFGPWHCEIGDARTVGYRCSLEEAKEVVETNMCDIFETCYTYACIEEVPPHLYPECVSRVLYKWNREKDCYEPIAVPDFLTRFQLVCGIG